MRKCDKRSYCHDIDRGVECLSLASRPCVLGVSVCVCLEVRTCCNCFSFSFSLFSCSFFHCSATTLVAVPVDPEQMRKDMGRILFFASPKLLPLSKLNSMEERTFPKRESTQIHHMKTWTHTERSDLMSGVTTTTASTPFVKC